ncbi:Mitochondrial tRNAs modification protein [Exophiala dermatitidis]|uniref:Gcp-like domain-containing protein n=2 Tax=Exophiala dermatitidis TaxID=5970 RepID=H6C6N9_EXODN|nr:uncharacterized protein HMPREF1120_07375 [Exophiala dermatitidis NIH/UT8656]KAJ4526150.1 Mitochondrial tRNAs modification protein [Exophiala dermatitidis]EHY59385.1 hypothetical protein HMPREF1120_07375 [Exophiala dermatitidis NIH/UT8656]KAJ4526905.1 Mitochondrial tRNAs modification protein [Exophiala dermatitidis]KAJ4532617.1 Mitochondrial tRNAs modification protein [Exophiala dermatitidis]KAJ4546870.1 Mitochondrial tRNAs modification protein [Exophiala dermatitidis]
MLHGLCRVKHVSTTCAAGVFVPVLRRNLLTLAIESSCDDTCVAILSKYGCAQRLGSGKTTLHFNERITAKNTGKGGIVPVEALKSHDLHLAKLLERALPSLPEASGHLPDFQKLHLRDGSIRQKPDFISATRGPGMPVNLAVGLNTAKALSVAWQIPMVGVHHMQGHALTPRLVSALHKDEKSVRDAVKPDFPFLTMLVSGGHTMLLYSKGLVEHEILASTTDTAIGDELDKCGRLILPKKLLDSTPDTSYGKYLSAYAFKTADDYAAWEIPRSRQEEVEKPLNKYGWNLVPPLSKTRTLAYSFASIASQVRSVLLARQNQMDEEERVLLARSALATAFEHLASRMILALETLQNQGVDISTLVVSGGVAANDFLRYYLRKTLDLRNFEHVDLVFPPVELCTDNAAMIAWAGMEMFKAGYHTDLGCTPVRKWSMDSRNHDGGILGIGGWLRAEDANLSG